MSIKERLNKDGTTVYDVVVYTGFTQNGKRDRKSVTCKTKRAAQIEEAKLTAMRDAMRGRSGRITLSQYIDTQYWPIAKGSLAATSLDTYEKEIRLRLRPHLGNYDVRDLDRTKIQRMLDQCETKDVAKKALGVLKTILNVAKGDGLILSNPATANYSFPPKGKSRDNGLVLKTFDQIYTLFDMVCEKGDYSIQRICATGLLLGMRPEERYALDWHDIDTDNELVAVNEAYVTASAKHGGNQMKETKTEKSTRILPMHPRFASWVKEQPSGGGPFILGGNGKRISPSTAKKRWARFLLDNPKAEPVTIENMRHSFATSYLEAGGSIEVLSKILGHATVATTIDRYVRPGVETMRGDLFNRL